MDLLSHVLLGAATAQVGFRQKLGRPATWLAMLAAIAPDADIVVGWAVNASGQSLSQLAPDLVHRGITHSLLVPPLLALLISLVWWRLSRRNWMRNVSTVRPPAVADAAAHPLAVAAKEEAAASDAQAAFRRPPRLLPRFLCILLAGLSHPLLDAATPYGTELLSPFSRERFAWDSIAILDFFFTGLLFLTLLACWALRTRSAARQRDDSSAPRGDATATVGLVGLLLAAGYVGAGRFCHDRIVSFSRQAAGPEKVISADAYPALGSILAWRSVVRTERQWLVARVRPWHDSARFAADAAKVPQMTNSVVRRAAEMDAVRAYTDFARGRVRTAYSQDRQGTHAIEFHDMRYSPKLGGIESRWPIVVKYDAKGKLVSVEQPQRPREWHRVFEEAWEEIWRP